MHVRRTKLIMCAANSVLTFHVSSPRPLNKSASSLRLYLFHCLSFSVLPHGFERRRTCSYCYISAPFLSFSSHNFLHLFTFAHPFFFSFLWFLPFFFFFFIAIFLYSHLFHVSFSFHSSQSLRNVRLLTTHIPRYSPIVVVIMRIMSTLGRCPLKVISSKISVFLSIDS